MAANITIVTFCYGLLLHLHCSDESVLLQLHCDTVFDKELILLHITPSGKESLSI